MYRLYAVKLVYFRIMGVELSRVDVISRRYKLQHSLNQMVDRCSKGGYSVTTYKIEKNITK